jgi:hypothetical protein
MIFYYLPVTKNINSLEYQIYAIQANHIIQNVFCILSLSNSKRREYQPQHGTWAILSIV